MTTSLIRWLANLCLFLIGASAPGGSKRRAPLSLYAADRSRPARRHLDRVRRHVELLGELAEREEAAPAQPREAVLEAVVPTQRPDHARREPLRDTRPRSASVEDGHDLGLGVLVEEAIDLSDDRGVGLTQLPRAERERQVRSPQ